MNSWQLLEAGVGVVLDFDLRGARANRAIW